MPPEPEKNLLTWEAPIRPFRTPNRQTLTTAGAIAGLIAIILAFAGEWMLIATLAALIFAYYLWSTVPPQATTYSITTWGVRAHNQLYRFDEINRWWTEEKWGHSLLVLETPLPPPPPAPLLPPPKHSTQADKKELEGREELANGLRAPKRGGGGFGFFL